MQCQEYTQEAWLRKQEFTLSVLIKHSHYYFNHHSLYNLRQLISKQHKHYVTVLGYLHKVIVAMQRMSVCTAERNPLAEVREKESHPISQFYDGLMALHAEVILKEVCSAEH